jgi:hypothetical protein
MRLRSRFGAIWTSKVRCRPSASCRNGTRHDLQEVGEEHVLRLDRHRSGLDLRQIEDVRNQVQKVRPGAVDGAGELDLPGRQVPVRVVAQLLTEDQDRVQRRAEFVAHIGQELRLVLGGERELGRLLLERPAGLLDLLVLRLDLVVAVGELLGLLLQLLVRLLQLALLRLELGGELLGLGEQPFRLHRRLDRVQDDADGGRQLLEEGHLQVGEVAQRGKLDHGLHLALEEHRQHDGVARDGLEQARPDRHHVRRHLRDQHAPGIAGALADEALAHARRSAWPRDRHPHRRTGAGARSARHRRSHLVDHPMLRLDERREFGQQHPADRREVALALQHVGEPGKVRLQPVLLRILIGGQPEVADHRVDVVLELGHLAARIDLDRARQVTLGHRGRDFRDGANLRGEVRGQEVHVVREVLPGARRARHVRLTAEPAFHAHLARNRRHLIGEGRERVRHVVDGLGQRRDLALRGDCQVLLQVAVRDRRHDLHDAADLLVRFAAMTFTVSVRSFQVPATPGTCAWPPSLPSVPTSLATRVTSPAKEFSWSTIVLMVDFSSSTSPRTSTVILRERSPRATAVVTSAMLRTCVVRFAASRFTLSVRSFQVPATPGTTAWPPSRPSVPTSRATRVTSPAKERS